MRTLVVDGARFLMRLYGLGLPTVAACTGHALAAGALLLLSADHRVGADGPFKIGLNEVGIGMALPMFAVELARERLTRPSSGRPPCRPASTTRRRRSAPATSTVSCPPNEVLDEALADAQRLAELRTGAYARTKLAARQGVISRILATLDADMATVDRPRRADTARSPLGSTGPSLVACADACCSVSSSALTYGSGDFFGGLSARRSPARRRWSSCSYVLEHRGHGRLLAGRPDPRRRWPTTCCSAWPSASSGRSGSCCSTGGWRSGE